LNYKFVGTDRSASQIKNPGVTPGFFVERTDDADVRLWPEADIAGIRQRRVDEQNCSVFPLKMGFEIVLTSLGLFAIAASSIVLVGCRRARLCEN
jgi:hypothetical protein